MQKTAYELRISDWGSDVCSSVLNLTWSAADFENFLEPRPDLARTMGRDLEKIVELLATNEWPFRIHATYDESIDRFLTVFERVNQNSPSRPASSSTMPRHSRTAISSG